MSVLNQLFNRGLLGAKCKTCLNLAISRIKLQQNRRDLHLKQMRQEIAQFLQTGHEAIARIRVEHVIREQNIWAAYEILELFCEFILARVPILESQRDCPPELREAIASIIFAAPRCSDLPDLLQIKNLFAAKYGKEFVLAASELRPDTSVNRTIIEKLSVNAPTAEVRLAVLKEIAKEFGFEWDSTKTEAEFNKKHDDLLDGSKQSSSPEAVLSKAPSNEHQPPNSTTMSHPITMPLNAEQPVQRSQPPQPSNGNKSSSPNSDMAGPSTSGSSNGWQRANSSQQEKNLQSCDVLEKARAAIAAADRASVAARAAALLVNNNYGVTK